MRRIKTAVFVMIVALPGVKALASESSPYVGEEAREISSLSKAEIDGLVSAEGMGYAKAAELNGYPGPAHVLELSEKLSLTADKWRETEALFARMEASAKELGADLVAAELALDKAFRSRNIDESSLSELVKDIGDIESRLRAIHLGAHLQQTEMPNDQQLAEYMALRGYNDAGHGSHLKPHHGK
ncbi:hypothetical protein [Marinobacter sp. HL-58]|uniref:hypothetical protein n=1 Tax=Marinobacter sp. HL-58 TaxID=1479237 RepID=UPI000488CEA1|nr:hypothetical protein [Marinobacter sp. HL-58]KPP98040.1 MAG: hypothetical protein HLUCCO03_08120 [Marinobacter sp. HL-58]